MATATCCADSTVIDGSPSSPAHTITKRAAADQRLGVRDLAVGVHLVRLPIPPRLLVAGRVAEA
jgi:hypothetical protein